MELLKRSLKEKQMKKTTRKLSLSRETLRHLEESTLPEVIAGAATQICFTVQATCTCPSIRIACTTTI